MIQYLVVQNCLNMKVKIIGEKMLAQCPQCRAIKMEVHEKHRKEYWQKSIAVFTNLNKELCHGCKQ